MAEFAVIENNKVINVIVCDSLELAEQLTGLPCVAYTPESPISMGEIINDKQLKMIEKEKAKREAEAAKTAAQAEANRIAAIEAENERLRKAEAERLAAEEASKPKPVTGIFVKVEPN